MEVEWNTIEYNGTVQNKLNLTRDLRSTWIDLDDEKNGDFIFLSQGVVLWHRTPDTTYVLARYSAPAKTSLL